LAQANQELTAVQGQLLHAERLAAIGEVVTAVAHGIRNPLAISARLRRSRPGVARRRSVRAHDQAPRRHHGRGGPVEGRLKELLQIVRPAERQRSPVDLNDTAREAVQMVSGRMRTARIGLTETLAPGLPPVSGNAMLLEQVVLSLLANAVEAIPNGNGDITVTTGEARMESGAPAVFLEVSDSGVGFPPMESRNSSPPSTRRKRKARVWDWPLPRSSPKRTAEPSP